MNRIRRIVLGILQSIIYACCILGSLLTTSLSWLKTTWGPVSFSTALFQLKTPLVGVDSNLVNTYIYDIALPAVLTVAGAAAALSLLTYLMKITGYSFKLILGGRCIADIKYRPVLITGTVVLLAASWFSFPSLARDTGIPDYIDSVINRSKIYEDNYVIPSADLLTFPENKRNLILIYAESMETTYSSLEEGGGKAVSLIPNLTALAEDNLFFSDTDAFGGATQTQGIGWTIAALLSSSSGVTYNLPVTENDMQSYSSFLPGLTTLGDILSNNGYANYFACGSDASFGGRRSFYITHGDYKIEDFNYASDAGYLPQGYHNGFWGMEDVLLFEMAEEELTQIAQSGTPFNYTLLTSDTHTPGGYICDYCDPHEGENSVETAVRCSDRQIYNFIEWIREQDWYENTTVVVIGDHLLMSNSILEDVDPSYQRHVYDCFINVYPGLEANSTRNRLFSSTDYFPTILASLGVRIEGDRLGLGTNLFSDRPTLLEQLGEDDYNTEILRHSEYYSYNFI